MKIIKNEHSTQKCTRTKLQRVRKKLTGLRSQNFETIYSSFDWLRQQIFVLDPTLGKVKMLVIMNSYTHEGVRNVSFSENFECVQADDPLYLTFCLFDSTIYIDRIRKVEINSAEGFVFTIPRLIPRKQINLKNQYP